MLIYVLCISKELSEKKVYSYNRTWPDSYSSSLVAAAKCRAPSSQFLSWSRLSSRWYILKLLQLVSKWQMCPQAPRTRRARTHMMKATSISYIAPGIKRKNPLKHLSFLHKLKWCWWRWIHRADIIGIFMPIYSKPVSNYSLYSLPQVTNPHSPPSQSPLPFTTFALSLALNMIIIVWKVAWL